MEFNICRILYGIIANLECGEIIKPWTLRPEFRSTNGIPKHMIGSYSDLDGFKSFRKLEGIITALDTHYCLELGADLESRRKLLLVRPSLYEPLVSLA
jgi:hypothetical protein